MLTPRVTALPPLPATIARSLVATGIGPTVHITTDTGQFHGPRSALDQWATEQWDRLQRTRFEESNAS